MNFDATKLAELKETHRANVAKEAIEAAKGEAAMKTAQAKMGDTLIRGATGIASILGKNDPKWEVPGDESLKKTARMSFVTFRRGQDHTASAAKIRKASLFVLDFQATLGMSEEGLASTAWIAFKHIYDIIRGKNRGATNYTVNDLIAYFFPPMTIAAAIAHLERVLKICRQYSIHENSVGKAMVTALGFDFADLMNNLPALEDALSLLKTKLNLVPMPTDFHALKRWIYLNSFVFADSDDQVRQFFIPRMCNIHTHRTSNPRYLTSLETLSSLNAFANSELAADDMLADIETMYNVLITILADTTYQAISGDIYNYFGSDLVKFPLAVDYSEEVILCDQEFLLQYANSDWLYSTPNFVLDQWSIKLSASGFAGQGVYYSNGELSGVWGYNDLENAQATAGDHLIRPIFKGELDETETFIATAMTFTNDQAQNGISYYYYDTDDKLVNATVSGNWFRLKSYRSEIFLRPAVYLVDSDSDVIEEQVLSEFYSSHGTSGSSDAFPLALMVDLDVWPKLVTDNGGYYWLNELDVYGLITNSALANIHAASLTALWNVPTVSGKGTTHSEGPRSSNRHGKRGGAGGGQNRDQREDPKPSENH